MLITCSFDYLTDTFSNKSFVVYLTVVDFVIPMFPLFTLYFLIAKEVIGYYRKQKAVIDQAAAVEILNRWLEVQG